MLSTFLLLTSIICAVSAAPAGARSSHIAQDIQCALVDDDGTELMGSKGVGNYIACIYLGTGHCEYFPADGSFSSGGSGCPQGVAQSPSATTAAASDDTLAFSPSMITSTSTFTITTTVTSTATATSSDFNDTFDAMFQGIQCATVDDDGTSLMATVGTGNYVTCIYAGAGYCEYFPADGSFSSGSSNCPEGMPQDPSATSAAFAFVNHPFAATETGSASEPSNTSTTVSESLSVLPTESTSESSAPSGWLTGVAAPTEDETSAPTATSATDSDAESVPAAGPTTVKYLPIPPRIGGLSIFLSTPAAPTGSSTPSAWLTGVAAPSEDSYSLAPTTSSAESLSTASAEPISTTESLSAVDAELRSVFPSPSLTAAKYLPVPPRMGGALRVQPSQVGGALSLSVSSTGLSAMIAVAVGFLAL
ncbi:hypothetical protein C8R43DRAFT_1242877 [Mycena crocata]|nr:hypothetical protein C8R43DRAFT_1242877 [Mycena crocata]